LINRCHFGCLTGFLVVRFMRKQGPSKLCPCQLPAWNV
jgi:hypothetical protein